MSKKGPTPRRKEPEWGEWKAFETAPRNLPETLDKRFREAMTNPADNTIWKNGVLAVMIEQEVATFGTEIPVLHLSYRADDRAPVRDWRHAQRMKSELCGANTEGLELYPHEERVLDGSNQYHMYVFPPTILLPFGLMGGRQVADNDDLRQMYEAHGGDWSQMAGQQRDWRPGEKDAARGHPGLLQINRVFPEWQDWAEGQQS